MKTYRDKVIFVVWGCEAAPNNKNNPLNPLFRMPAFMDGKRPEEETMLIRYSCKDMGLNCSFIVKGATMDEVIKKALEHVLESHTQDFNGIQSPAEIEKMKLALNRSTRVVAG